MVPNLCSYWTIKTHVHHVCTLDQRRCARTVLLVGSRLHSVSARASLAQPHGWQQHGQPRGGQQQRELNGGCKSAANDNARDAHGHGSQALAVEARGHCSQLWTGDSTIDLAGPALAKPVELPPLPDELWVLALGWLRRADLGRSCACSTGAPL
jgi:hypothetical protein